MVNRAEWEKLKKEEWDSWRLTNNLSLRQAGRLFNVTGELVRQWEIGCCVPNLETQETMLSCIKGGIDLPNQEKIVATNQELKNYLEKRNLKEIKPSLLAKLSGITIVKAKQWLAGDLIINCKDKLNNTDAILKIKNFLNGKYDELIVIKKNSWQLISPEQLKNYRIKNKLSVDEMVALVGTSRPNYYNWEQNKYAPDLVTQEKLLTILKASNDNDQADSKNSSTEACPSSQTATFRL